MASLASELAAAEANRQMRHNEDDELNAKEDEPAVEDEDVDLAAECDRQRALAEAAEENMRKAANIGQELLQQVKSTTTHWNRSRE